MEGTKLRVSVIDMQPITPAVGGGRQRLLGLYHALGPDIECTYVGTYDWPGEPSRDQQITPGLREIVVPLSPEHHAAAAALSQQIAGRTVIDVAFADQAHLSPDFLRVAREHIAGADIIVFSHPWCFPPLADALRPSQLVVYDSHNVEALLRASLLDNLPAAAPLLSGVAGVEYELCQRADLILACSDEDVDLFERIFNADPVKLHIVPNGAFVERFPEVGQVERMALRKKLGLPVGRAIAIFLGSMYGPNTDAARFIAQDMAPACPGMSFVIAGGVGDALAGVPLTDNLLVTGRVDDRQRDDLLLAADLALNPMAAGSGTNIKMFDYMAAGLPVLTTDIGARGICTAHSAPKGIFVEPLATFPARCLPIATTTLVNPAYSLAVRALVRKRYSWEHISGELGSLLRRASARNRVKTKAKSATRVAMMTTWNVTCGIGEHASYLAEAMEAAGAEVVVLGNDLNGHQPLGFERDLHFAVSRTWHWDNRTWQSGIDQSRLAALLQLAHPDLLIIQHHTAYAPFCDVEAAVRAARTRGVAVIVEMHNARDVPAENKERLCVLGAHLIAHHPDGIADVSLVNMPSARILPLPVLIHSTNHLHGHSNNRDGTIVISGFGFLRPYKGLPVLIEALALLRPKYPGIRYVGLHALYPGDSSEQHLQECMQLAKMHGLLDAIRIETDFLPLEEIEGRLSDADIVVLPYQPSNEGASSAVNMALAAGRPVIVSPSGIFKSIGDAAFMVTRHDPAAYAEALDLILSDPQLSESLTRRASEWAEQNSYANAAALMLDPSYYSSKGPFLRGTHGSRL